MGVLGFANHSLLGVVWVFANQTGPGLEKKWLTSDFVARVCSGVWVWFGLLRVWFAQGVVWAWGVL